MNPDELNRIDLNLLVAFNALMDERNVSRAAERLHVTQPAMSKTLQRLRDLFGDPLFTRTPKGLVPTARSLELHQPLVGALAQLTRLMTPAEFDPAQLQRTFNLAVADPLAALFVPALLETLAQQAPGVQLKLMHYSGDSVQSLPKGTIDFVCGIITDNLPAGIHGRQLSEDQPAVLVRPQHPLAGRQRISFEELVAWPHIKPWFQGINDRGPLDLYLKSIGLQRQIRLEASHFMTIRESITRSDCMLVGLRYSWWQLLGADNVVPVGLPEEYDNRRFASQLFWDERNHSDPAYQWFRELVVSTSMAELQRIRRDLDRRISH